MEGVTIIETAVLTKLIETVETMGSIFLKVAEELQTERKPYLSIKEVADMTGFSRSWVDARKQDIGYMNKGGSLRFRRKDVEEYMEEDLFKFGDQTTWEIKKRRAKRK